MKTKLKKIGIIFVVLCILCAFAFLVSVLITLDTSRRVNQQDSDLVDLYYDDSDDEFHKDEIILDDGRGHNTMYTSKDIDCILYLDTLGVVLPVMKGNTDRDLALFRTVVSNNKMVLGATNYGIMGHHARDMSVSLAGIDRMHLGDTVRIVKGKREYTYSVTGSVASYADNCDFLFNPKSGNIVYLFTCDYSLAKGRVAYRVVTCSPVSQNAETNNDTTGNHAEVQTTEQSN